MEDVVQEGDEVLVKCIGLEKGRIRLSRREAIADEAKRKEEEAAKAAEAEDGAEATEEAAEAVS